MGSLLESNSEQWHIHINDFHGDDEHTVHALWSWLMSFVAVHRKLETNIAFGNVRFINQVSINNKFVFFNKPVKRQRLNQQCGCCDMHCFYQTS